MVQGGATLATALRQTDRKSYVVYRMPVNDPKPRFQVTPLFIEISQTT